MEDRIKGKIIAIAIWMIALLVAAIWIG